MYETNFPSGALLALGLPARPLLAQTAAGITPVTSVEGITEYRLAAGAARRIAALTPEQVSAAAKKYLDYSKLTIVKAGDFARRAKPKASAP